MDVSVLFESKSLVVCEKPVAMLTLPAEGGEESLIDILERQLGHGTLYPVHRLDRLTGGLVVFAKTKTAAAELSRIFSEHENKKDYLCVIHGTPERKTDTLCDLLFADKRANKAYITDKSRKGVKEARLSYRVLATATYKEKPVSLLFVSLHTGRMHQIRAQLSHRGHALLGDGKYGSRENGCTVALHACHLAFSLREEYEFFSRPQKQFPWDLFDDELYNIKG